MRSKAKPEADITKLLEVDRASGTRKGMKRWLVITLLAAVMAIVFVIWKKADHSNSVQYKTEQVRRGNLTVIVTAKAP